MPKIEINVPHELEPKEAVEKLQAFSGQVREQFGEQVTSIEETWDEERDALTFSVKARGMAVDGNLVVTETCVEVISTLPFAALPFRGMIESYIRKAISEAIS